MQKNKKNDFFYNSLQTDEFIKSHGFRRSRIESFGFETFATTLISRSGRKITIGINIHDEEPDEAELVMQFLNRSSIEQMKMIASKVNEKYNKDIGLFTEEFGISLVAYFSIYDISDIVGMMKDTLIEVNKNVLFVME